MTAVALTHDAPGIDLNERYFRSSAGSLRRLWHDVPASVSPSRTTIDIRPNPYTSVLDRLESFLELPESWDSYGAVPISPAAVAATRNLLVALEVELARHPDSGVPSLVGPVPDGGTQLEWQSAGRLLEITVGPDGGLRSLLDRGRDDSPPRFRSRALRSIPEAIRIVSETLQSWE